MRNLAPPGEANIAPGETHPHLSSGRLIQPISGPMGATNRLSAPPWLGWLRARPYLAYPNAVLLVVGASFLPWMGLPGGGGTLAAYVATSVALGALLGAVFPANPGLLSVALVFGPSLLDALSVIQSAASATFLQCMCLLVGVYAGSRCTGTAASWSGVLVPRHARTDAHREASSAWMLGSIGVSVAAGAMAPSPAAWAILLMVAGTVSVVSAWRFELLQDRASTRGGIALFCGYAAWLVRDIARGNDHNLLPFELVALLLLALFVCLPLAWLAHAVRRRSQVP